MDSVLLKPTDAELVLAMNNAAVPNVNEATEAELAELIEMSGFTVALEEGGTLLGFVLTLPPGVGYASENYRFFSERYDQFVYVDRIVVADGARNRGIGAKLYDLIGEYAAEHGIPRVLCEVNLEPPNPGSLRFHERIGFVEVGQQRTKGGTYLVSLLAKEF
ncbi:GNAT family N-acetyltransferase [Kibdelosporangium phytohabitans]|uniref:GNAT family N-acetyltransferase n=1 Tax=Kibdelosporangium phytohabitans TaxID=860235 RepID=UPI0007C851CD|nr:GNAT family N-acetyltransferase [Kibdelosporangium phytohabitans]MBE1470845.1 putative GNAT superfamily acetyltransferase [Kibdelosporangium phytohabitans]